MRKTAWKLIGYEKPGGFRKSCMCPYHQILLVRIPNFRPIKNRLAIKQVGFGSIAHKFISNLNQVGHSQGQGFVDAVFDHSGAGVPEYLFNSIFS